MKDVRFLNSKDKKEIAEKLEEQFGFKGKIEQGMLRDENGRIFIVTNDIIKIEQDLEKLRLSQIGIEFGRIFEREKHHKKDNKGVYIMLTVEGSQMIGGRCSKNIIEFGNENASEWFLGKDIAAELVNGCDIDIDICDGRVFLLRFNLDSKEEFIGCSKLRNGMFLNSLSKERRQKNIIGHD